MLNCKEISHLASDFLDNDLDWKTSLSVRMHILICVHCRRFVHHLRSSIHLVRGMERETATVDEIEHIVTALTIHHRT